MRHLLRSLIVVLSLSVSFALAGGACNKGSLSSDGGGGNDSGEPSTLACNATSDCTRTEIDHEITSSADCVCLYGCPFLAVNVETANRRMAQWMLLCKSNQLNCGVDDCAVPSPVTCNTQHMCEAPALAP
jgi:hypothetical protein